MISNEVFPAYALSKLKTFRQKLTWIFFYFKNDHKLLGEYNNEYIYAWNSRKKSCPLYQKDVACYCMFAVVRFLFNHFGLLWLRQ